jgi:hypothetical protein
MPVITPISGAMKPVMMATIDSGLVRPGFEAGPGYGAPAPG